MLARGSYFGLAPAPQQVWDDIMELALAHKPFRATAPYDWDAILALLQAEFAYMQGRIDPPSSMLALTPENIAAEANVGEIWVIEIDSRPAACIFLSPRANTLYLGKIAVRRRYRGKGLARQLIETAGRRARDLGLGSLTLESRVELTDNHAAFTALGFSITGTTTHPGFSHPTSITMQRKVFDQ